VRKHCRKTHPEWLREVDLDKAHLNCRWSAYCTRTSMDGVPMPPGSEGITSPPKRVRLSEGGASVKSPTAPDERARSSFGGASGSQDDQPAPMAHPNEARPAQPPKRMLAPHQVAMDGKSALVPLRQGRASSLTENMRPPVRARTEHCTHACLSRGLNGLNGLNLVASQLNLAHFSLMLSLSLRR